MGKIGKCAAESGIFERKRHRVWDGHIMIVREAPACAWELPSSDARNGHGRKTIRKAQRKRRKI
jgi:hypothetical protein